MFCKAKFAVFFLRSKFPQTLSDLNVEFFNVKPGGTYGYR
jgi:hypothetical protein